MNHTITLDAYGQFILSLDKLIDKWQSCKAIIFDWDGVFNNGSKDAHGGSTYSETDSMGTNMLRLSNYLNSKKQLLVAVISGETNPNAKKWATREHIHALYSGVKNKADALKHFCAQHEIYTNEVAFVFDDVLDFSMAQLCGLRLMIHDSSKVQTHAFAVANNLIDYLTLHEGGKGAVRELCELLMAMNENDRLTLQTRMDFEATYTDYISERNSIGTLFYQYSIEDGIKAITE